MRRIDHPPVHPVAGLLAALALTGLLAGCVTAASEDAAEPVPSGLGPAKGITQLRTASGICFGSCEPSRLAIFSDGKAVLTVDHTTGIEPQPSEPPTITVATLAPDKLKALVDQIEALKALETAPPQDRIPDAATLDLAGKRDGVWIYLEGQTIRHDTPFMKAHVLVETTLKQMALKPAPAPNDAAATKALRAFCDDAALAHRIKPAEAKESYGGLQRCLLGADKPAVCAKRLGIKPPEATRLARTGDGFMIVGSRVLGYAIVPDVSRSSFGIASSRARVAGAVEQLSVAAFQKSRAKVVGKTDHLSIDLGYRYALGAVKDIDNFTKRWVLPPLRKALAKEETPELQQCMRAAIAWAK